MAGLGCLYDVMNRMILESDCCRCKFDEMSLAEEQIGRVCETIGGSQPFLVVMGICTRSKISEGRFVISISSRPSGSGTFTIRRVISLLKNDLIYILLETDRQKQDRLFQQIYEDIRKNLVPGRVHHFPAK